MSPIGNRYTPLLPGESRVFCAQGTTVFNLFRNTRLAHRRLIDPHEALVPFALQDPRPAVVSENCEEVPHNRCYFAARLCRLYNKSALIQ